MATKQFTTRKTCRICGSSKLLNIMNFGRLSLSDFVPLKKRTPVEKFPVHLVVCRNCTLVQLKHTYPLRKLYNNNYGYRSGINETMRSELADVVTKSSKLANLKKGDLVIDIGANDGTLLSNYSKTLLRVGVDPIEKFAQDSKKHANYIVNDFFSYESFISHIPKLVYKQAKLITAIAMFYDLDDPNKFISDISQLLANNGILVIQQNYLVSMLNQQAFDNIVHEHLEYYSLTSLDNLLQNHGLMVFDVELRDINGGSFRTYIGHIDQVLSKKTKTVAKILAVEKKLSLKSQMPYKKFHDHLVRTKQSLLTFIKNETKKGKKVYVYGASTLGNTMLQFFDLNNKLIGAALERNPEKWGKKIASVGIPIISEEQGRREKPDYLLVMPWFFKEEFVIREQAYLKAGGHFIFPLPKFEII